MMLAKVAPAPITINTEGSAQHINVDEDANKDMKLADRSNMLNFHQLIVCCILTIHYYFFFDFLKFNFLI